MEKLSDYDKDLVKRIGYDPGEWIIDWVTSNHKNPELAYMTLKDLEQELEDCWFYRISRYYIVNAEYCEDVLTNGVNKLVLTDKKKLDLSRDKIKGLKDFLHDYCKKGQWFVD